MIDEHRRRYLGLCAAGSTLALAGCLSGMEGVDPRQDADSDDPTGGDDEDSPEKVDDWQYDPDESDSVFVASKQGKQINGTQFTPTSANMTASVDAEESIGLAVGGAADVGTFRRNVYEGYLPIPETMAYEGLFHDYYFDTGGDGSCTSWFCPTYTPAVTDDPLSGEIERYLSVGLESGLAQSAFERPPLNLVLVLDVSGSMSAGFSEYYYDRFGNRQEVEGETDRPKIEASSRGPPRCGAVQQRFHGRQTPQPGRGDRHGGDSRAHP